MSSSCWT